MGTVGRIRRVVVATLWALGLQASASSLLAQSWVPASPRGGAVQAIAYAPSAPRIAYLATPAGGIYRSEDDAVSWRFAGKPPGVPATDLRVDPFDPEILFTRNREGHLFRSADGGATWVPLAPDLTFNELAADAHHEGLLFAAAPYRGLYRSTDHGDTWSVAAFPEAFVLSVASSPFADGLLFAALGPSATSDAQTLLRSTDGGEHWNDVPGFMVPVGFDELQPHWAFDPAHPGTIYALYAYTDLNSEAVRGPVLRSSDGGLTWTLPSNVDLRDLAVAADGTLFGNAYFGVVSSRDQGTTWIGVEEQIPRDLIQRVATSPVASGTVLAAGSQGLWKSTDSGARWRNPSRGIPITYASSIAVAPLAPSKLLTIAEGRVFESLDRGTTWRRLHSVFSGPEPYALHIDPSHPDRIFGATIDYISNFPVRSDDGGRSWRELPFPYSCGGSLCQVDIDAFAIDPTHADTLYAAGYYFIHFVGEGHYFLRSRDGGRTWLPLRSAEENFTGLKVDPRSSTVLYGFSRKRLYKSVDEARTWSRVGRGLPYLGLRSLEIDPDDTRKVYVGTTRGLFASADGGVTFRPLGEELRGKEVDAIVIDPLHPNRLYVSGLRTGVYQGDARTRRFEPINDGLPIPEFGFFPLALDPREPATLYTGAYGQGLFRLEVE